METQTYSNQSWLDLSMQLYGSTEKAFDLAFANNGTITDDLPAGITVSKIDLKTNKVVLLGLEHVPATALTAELEKSVNTPTGIGYMIIENTFKVG